MKPNIELTSFIIPFRYSESSARKANLLTVLQWLACLPQLEVILVEHDSSPKADAKLLAYCDNYIFIEDEKLFNRGRCFNAAFLHAKGDIFAFGDGDIIMDVDIFNESQKYCRTTADAVNPYGKIIDLDLGSNKYIPSDFRLSAINLQGKARKGICFCGGLVFFRRSFFEELGGFDESFEGWGGEDNAMSVKVHRSIDLEILPHRLYYTFEKNIAYHLWHESTPKDTYKHKGYARNLALSEQYYNLEKEDIKDLLTAQRQLFSQKYIQNTP